MNYRHAFHAGNHADILKHMTLLACLRRLSAKETPFAVLDTHAGPGLYDLTGEAARRSPEWEGGIGRLWDWADAPPAAADLVNAVRRHNADGALKLYPGSPALVRDALRANDRLAACELHPADAGELKARFRGDPRVQVHARDGWEALGALLPLPEKRGLVLIDPPYEAEGELARAGAALSEALKRFGHGVFLWWRPLKDGRALDAADDELRQTHKKEMLRADLCVAAPEPAGRLAGSSMLVVNPPFGLAAALREALPAATARLRIEDGARWRLDAD